MPKSAEDVGAHAARLRVLMDTDEAGERIKDWPPITDEQRARLARLVLDDVRQDTR